MSQKQYYIDDFKVRNCTQYGEYKIIDGLNSGDDVKIEYDKEEKTITVMGREHEQKIKPEHNQENGTDNDQENGTDNDQENGSEDNWKTFGELEVPEQMRKILVPLLQGLPGSDAFICKMNIADKKVVINERLQVSVWAANDEVENKEDEKKVKSKP